MRPSAFALAALSLCLLHCEQIIGADFSAPAETVPANPRTGGVEPDPPRYPDASAFCLAFAEALCQPTVAEGCWPDGSCITSTQAACVARMGSNRGYLNEEYADGCISATLALGKSGRADTKSQRQPDCIRAFGVHAGAGEPCSSEADCTRLSSPSEDLRCMVADDKTYRCQAISSSNTQDEGEACRNQLCGSSTYCDVAATTPLCVKRIESGSCILFKEACTQGYACINGSCAPTKPPQGICTGEPGLCGPTSTCEQAEPECTTSCTSRCALNCSQDAECGLETFCIKGKCRDSLVLKVDPPDGCEALVADPLLGAF
jgi:hypothetical protein